MCFTPEVSLTTAIIEFVLATVLLLRFRKTEFRNFFAVFIYWLGAYQLSEFFVCTSSYPIFWAGVGIIIYSFLPAMALHGMLRITGRNANLPLLYSIPVVSSLFVFFFPEFVTSAQCASFFVSVDTLLFRLDTLFAKIYFFVYAVFYYFGFIAYAGWLGMEGYFEESDVNSRRFRLVALVATLLVTVPMLIFAMASSLFAGAFPSVLCEFAILVSICAFIGAYLEGKIKR